MSGSYGNKVLWGVLDNHFVVETNDNGEIGLRESGFNLFGVYERGYVRELLSEYPYLFIPMNILPGNWENKL